MDGKYAMTSWPLAWGHTRYAPPSSPTTSMAITAMRSTRWRDVGELCWLMATSA